MIKFVLKSPDGISYRRELIIDAEGNYVDFSFDFADFETELISETPVEDATYIECKITDIAGSLNLDNITMELISYFKNNDHVIIEMYQNNELRKTHSVVNLKYSLKTVKNERFPDAQIAEYLHLKVNTTYLGLPR